MPTNSYLHPSETLPEVVCDGVMHRGVDVDGARTKKERFRYEVTSWA